MKPTSRFYAISLLPDLLPSSTTVHHVVQLRCLMLCLLDKALPTIKKNKLESYSIYSTLYSNYSFQAAWFASRVLIWNLHCCFVSFLSWKMKVQLL
ncbi:hypothetical protein LINPERHAP2_LOCUS21050 [Linum perenne]